MTGEGYIKLYRSMTEWEWYTDIPCKVLFLHCLLQANYKAGRFRGRVINPGQFVTSYKNLAEETCLSVRQVRHAINKLKLTNELSHEGHSQYSIITVNNWNLFQENGKQNGKRMANEWQTNGKQMATIEEGKKERKKEGKNTTSTTNSEKKFFENSENYEIYGKYYNVAMTAEQYNRLLGMCTSQKLLDELVDNLSENIETGKEQPFRSDYPNAHYVRLVKYREYRLQNPDKFSKTKTENPKEVIDGWTL